MRKVEKIKVVNKAAAVINFAIRYLDSSNQWKTVKWNSGNFPVLQSVETEDLGTLGEGGVPAGAIVAPNVHAKGASGGKDRLGEPQVQYEKNGQIAEYTVTGSLLGISVTTEGE